MKFNKIDYVVLFVESLEKSIPFYKDILGIPLKHKAENYAQFDCDNIKLGLFTRRATEDEIGIRILHPTEQQPSMELGFIVDDVDSAYKELADKGATAFADPKDREWGQRTAYIQDPDGNLIELVQNL